jgi:hypothetical protein
MPALSSITNHLLVPALFFSYYNSSTLPDCLFPKKQCKNPRNKGNSRIRICCHSPKYREQKTKSSQENTKRIRLRVMRRPCVHAGYSVTPEIEGRHISYPEPFFTRILRWPDVDIVELSTPFHGIGVRFRGSVYVPEDADLPGSISAEVQKISRQTPSVRFVLLRTECWGGICSNWGQFIRGGRVVVNAPLVLVQDINQPTPDGVLHRLISYLGADIGPSEMFEPLSGDFPRKPDPGQ